MDTKKKLRGYGQFDLSFQTEEASPGKLVLMLFDKACASLTSVTLTPFTDLESLSYEERFNHIARYHQEGAKVLEILAALEGLVDLKNGGQVAEHLLLRCPEGRAGVCRQVC